MRIVSSSKDNRQFSIDLLLIGNGVNAFITLNNLCILVKNVEELTEKVNPDISNISTKTLNWFQERATLFCAVFCSSRVINNIENFKDY